VTKLRDDPEPVKVVTATVVEVAGGSVLLTTVVLAAGAAVEAGGAGFGLVVGLVLSEGSIYCRLVFFWRKF
jgi:hypothetical protein